VSLTWVYLVGLLAVVAVWAVWPWYLAVMATPLVFVGGSWGATQLVCRYTAATSEVSR